MPLYYNRCIGSALLKALSPSGPASGLVRRQLSDAKRVDIHLRSSPDKRRSWVTLYCGLTNALDLVEADGAFQLKTVATWQAYDRQGLPWGQSLTSTALAAVWPKVEEYLDNVIPAIEKSRWFGREGAIQNAVGGMCHGGFTVFDREVVLRYSNSSERSQVKASEAAALFDAVGPPPMHEEWWKPPTNLGNECDALALDTDGNLLAVEVKYSGDTSGIVWAPLQASFYARLFQRWVADDQMCSENVRSMLSQRTRLGLVPQQDWLVQKPMAVRPIVIIGGGMPPSLEARRRCKIVRDRIVESGLGGDLSISLLVGNRLEPFFGDG